MATSLQQQLAQIARSSTNQLDLKAQRTQHSKSLLFEPRDAATQTFDTIYQICADAFNDLCMLDARFAPFAQNLFSEQSKSEDRGQMTAEENKQLDGVIDSFLGLVAGRLLLRPAVKAVEWLVRRFRIHEHNTESLVLAFLPYHANPVFPTMLSILPATLPPAYKFLHPYMSSLSSPPRHAILYAAINTPAFFSALNRYTVHTAALGHHSAPVLGFWASITAQAINGLLDGAQSGRAEVRRQREEDLLLRVVPLLQDALRIRNVPELFLGSCMIITILVTKTQLQDKLLDALMDAVVKSTTSQTLDDALTCLAVIAEERQSLKLPRSTARALVKTDALQQHMSVLCQRQHAARLYTGLALSVLDDSSSSLQQNPDALDIVDFPLTADMLTSHQKSVLISALLRVTPELLQTSQALAFRERLAHIFSTLCQSTITAPLVRDAAAKASLTIEALEVQLQTALAPADALAITLADADVDMAEEPSGQASDLLETTLAALPKELDPRHSFLASTDPALFDRFAHAFLTIVQQRKDASQLLDMPVFHGAGILEVPTLLSFLARLWTSRSPVVSRLSALKAATTKLRAVSERATDMQALLPYALLALSDPAQGVRRAAADFLLLVSSLYKASADKGKVSATLNVWGRDSVYAERTKSVIWLSSQDAYKILSTAVVPNLEECVLDQSQISRVLTTAMNGTTQADHPSKAVAADLKASLRASLFSTLCSHATSTALLNARVQLLSLLSHAGKVGSAGRTQTLIPSLREWLALTQEARSSASSAFHLETRDLDKAYVNCLGSRSSDELDCLKSLSHGELGDDAQLPVMAIRRLKQLWNSMKPGAQTTTAEFLLDLALDSRSDDAAVLRQSEAVDVLRQVTISTDVLISLLETVPDLSQMEDKPSATKRRRTSRSELAKAQNIDVPELQSVIRRLTTVLELIEGSKPEKHPELLKNLFHVLSELQHYKQQLGSNLVYLQQLVLGCMLSIVDSFDQSAKVDRLVLRTDLLVECVRGSTNAQVHNSALLLISSLATWAPDLVLHSVMPIFTFMSTTLLRQGDDYSAHIIDQTVSRVVPPLAASLRKQKEDLLTGSAELILSFVAAFEHIPLHRRLRLFSHLVTALGPKDSLAAIVASLAEKYPIDRRVPSFSVDLMGSFSASDQLAAALKYLDLVHDALQPKRGISELIFGFSEKTPQQIEESIVHLLSSLAKLLQSRPLHSQIARGLDRGSDEATLLQSTSAEVLEKVMSLSKTLEDRPKLHAANNAVLTSALSLLPTPHYIQSAKSLLAKPEESLRLMVLQSLETRGRDAKPSDSSTTSALLNVLPDITAILNQETNVKLKHRAIACVDVICEKFGKKDTAVVLAAAEIVASDSAYGSTNDELRVISLLCLSTMVEVLKDDLVPLLPKTITKAFEYLDSATNAESTNERLHDAVYAFIGSVLEQLSWMFSAKVLDQALRLTQKSAGCGATARVCEKSREQFYVLASQQLDPKELLSAIDRTFEDALAFEYRACYESLRFLSKTIVAQTKSVLIKHSSILFSILTKAFDLRRQFSVKSATTSEEEIASLEGLRDNVTLDAIMRLNDATFRPFFMRLVQWATEDLPRDDEAGRVLRLTSLYSFLAKFFESLKSIVTSYSSYLLEQTATILQETQPSNERSTALLQNVLEATTSSFKHDQDDFWQAPAHFTALAQPLLTLLTHISSANTTDTTPGLPIIPAITQLATAAASPDHHKTLNTALLRLLRHDEPSIRLSAVRTQQALTEKLGEDWLALLPEMLPFISELQEDDDESVERETLGWIRCIEGILGESLEGMLQ